MAHVSCRVRLADAACIKSVGNGCISQLIL